VVHPLEQPVKSQSKENQANRANQVTDDTETEEPLVSRDIVGGRGRVPVHEQLVGYVNQAEWADQNEQQVPDPATLPGLRVELMFPPYFVRGRSKVWPWIRRRLSKCSRVWDGFGDCAYAEVVVTYGAIESNPKDHISMCDCGIHPT
jgi:hypothetical protein